MFELILPFDTDDPEFVRGFEAGRLWERIKADHTNWDQMIHDTNTEMIMRMCEAENRDFRAEILEDGWVQVFVT